jgi:hypothetical protein
MGFPVGSYQRQTAETLCWTRHVVFLTDRGLAGNLMPLPKTFTPHGGAWEGVSSHEGKQKLWRV